MSLKDMLSERNQSQEHIIYDIPFIWSSRTSKTDQLW